MLLEQCTDAEVVVRAAHPRQAWQSWWNAPREALGILAGATIQRAC